MTIPDYQTFMRPVLEVLSDGAEHTSRQIVKEAADVLGIPEADREELLTSGRQTVLRSRVGWALSYLSQANAVRRVRRGVFVGNDRGSELLASRPGYIGKDDLLQFDEFQQFLRRSMESQDPASPTARSSRVSAPHAAVAQAQVTVDRGTPVDRALSAAKDANAEVASELLERVNEQDPDFLERVVLDLLEAMGYTGARGSTRHLGRSGDEGVDGVLRQDVLGLDLIYVQAKRYASGRTVGRPELQAFAGALQGAQASRGVFITTSQFSRDAVDFAERVPQRIILIDGPELARLMVAHGVGVQTDQVITLVKVDEDFFE
jgi:restriction system protein